MMLPIISVLIGISLMYYIRQKRAEKEMDEIVNSISPSNDSNENIGTRDLCLELLRQLNCEVRIEHDDIYFTYQNEKFMIEASNESAANSTSKCKITKCFCKSTPLVLRNSIFFLVSH